MEKMETNFLLQKTAIVGSSHKIFTFELEANQVGTFVHLCVSLDMKHLYTFTV